MSPSDYYAAMPAPPAEIRVLFVCTANVCRSPMAAGMLRALAPDAIRVASAGFLPSGAPIDPNTQQVLDRFDIDMAARPSRTLNRSLVLGSQLVLTMTAEHAVRIISDYPTAQPSLYSLRHFSEIASRRSDLETVEDWLARLHRETPRNYAAGLNGFDIDDPIGQPQYVFDAIARDMQSALAWFVRCAHVAD